MYRYTRRQCSGYIIIENSKERNCTRMSLWANTPHFMWSTTLKMKKWAWGSGKCSSYARQNKGLQNSYLHKSSSQKYNKVKQKVMLTPRGHAVLEQPIEEKVSSYVWNSLFIINSDVQDDWTVSNRYLGILNNFCIPFLVSERVSKNCTSCNLEHRHICHFLVVRLLTIILLASRMPPSMCRY